MELVCLLSGDTDTWTQVSGLIRHGDWEKVIVVGDEDARTFTHEKEFEFVKVDLTQKIKELRDDFSKKLKGKFAGMEAAVTIAAGNGKEHMSLISALINLPMGVRFAALTRDGVIDL